MSNKYILKKWISLQEASILASELLCYEVSEEELILSWADGVIEGFYHDESSTPPQRMIHLLPQYTEVNAKTDCHSVGTDFLCHLANVKEGYDFSHLAVKNEYLHYKEDRFQKIKALAEDFLSHEYGYYIITDEIPHRYLMQQYKDYDKHYNIKFLKVNDIFSSPDDFINDNDKFPSEPKKSDHKIVICREEFIVSIRKLLFNQSSEKIESNSEIEKLSRIIMALSTAFAEKSAKYKRGENLMLLRLESLLLK